MRKLGSFNSTTRVIRTTIHRHLQSRGHRCLDLVWAETGGPAIVGCPELTGFGSRLIERTVSSQLRGRLTYDWQDSGLVVTIAMPQDRLAL